MKTRRIIYISLGILFILLDVVTTLHNRNDIKTQATPDGYGVGYIIGSQILLYIGLLFFYGSHRVAKKLKEKQQHEWEEQIQEIGKK